MTYCASAADPLFDYRMLATSKTSTMEKELNEAAGEGYRFSRVMGGKLTNGGQVIVAMVREANAAGRHAHKYKLLATGKTSTMQTEIQQLADQGYSFVDQTVFESALGGKEVVVIMELDPSRVQTPGASYRLLATTKASTMEKELQEAGLQGYELIGFSVGKTGLGGSEIITILRKDK
ncbi:MAG: hypothetical protein NTW74_20335 [Acidobacteria bacterium]|nr:hypothetical protein [Acidobacteriota bacterium]